MSIIQKSMFFAVLAFVAIVFTTSQAQAQQTREHVLLIQMNVEPQAAAFIKFDGIDGESQVQEGRNIVGRNTRTGDQLIVVVRKGKLVEFGVQPARGDYKALSPNASPCTTIHCSTFNPPKCFILPGGACVCVCGPWITAAGGN